MGGYHGFAILAWMLLLGACATPQSRLLNTEVGKYSIIDAGHGAPAVVFEAGLGGTKKSWQWIFSDIAKTTRVFAYDRGGNGESVARSNDRSAAQIVQELHALLAAADVPPPYVFVGHLHGAMYVNLYGRTYPEEIAGAIFVSPWHEDLTARCDAAGGRNCRTSATRVGANQDRFDPESYIIWEAQEYRERSVARRSRISAATKERIGEAESIRQLHDAKPFPPVPLVVLSGTRTLRQIQNESGMTLAVWTGLQKELAALSPQGRYVDCQSCGFAVHADNPRMVIDAVSSVVAQARGTKR